MHRDDLLQATLTYVWGACVQYNRQMSNHVSEDQLDQWVTRVHGIVWKYLHGKQTLDGSCSDFECGLALKANSVFAHLVDRAAY